MNGRPCSDQRAQRVTQLELGLTHLHAGVFRVREDGVRGIDGGLERVDLRPHCDGSLPTLVVIQMALPTNSLIAHAEELIARSHDRVVRVAGGAAWFSQVDQRLGMLALSEEIGHHGVTTPADVADP